MVAVNLMPSTVWSLKYTAHRFPTIDNVELLRAEAQFWSLREEKLRHLLTDTSQRTAVEAGDGHFLAVNAKRKVSRLSTAAELAAIFNGSKISVLEDVPQKKTRILRQALLEDGGKGQGVVFMNGAGLALKSAESLKTVTGIGEELCVQRDRIQTSHPHSAARPI
jgi:hypothetical protein